MKLFRSIKLNFTSYLRMQNQKTVGTHSGAFHMDEVLGTVMLTKYTNEFKEAKIIRSRDENVLKSLDLILDVGRIYEPSLNKFDHHQKEFETTFSPDYNIKLSSAGLIYKHFGREVVKNISQQLLDKYNVNLDLSQENIDLIYQRLYDNFIMYVDAVDNGVNQYPNDVKPRYKVNSHLSSRVARLNPASYEEGITFDERFFEAMKIAEEELIYQIREIVLGWLTARIQVEKAFENRLQIHQSGEIIAFDKPCAWKDPLFELEKKHNCVGLIKFVLFKDNSGSEGWRVQAVPEKLDGYSNRKSLKKEWNGISKEEIAKISGIQDVVFCHASGFIGGAQSYESVLKMATLSLQD